MIFRCWGDLCVLFHPESGDTHLLPRVYGTILQYLEQNNTDEVVATLLLTKHLVPDRATASEYIRLARQEFGQLGLLP
jgi:PqqD family protein of HPr-rel-A system